MFARSMKKMNKKELPIITKRKLVTSGGSIVVSIPKEWLKRHSLNSGDEVLIIANNSLKILPRDEKIINKLRENIKTILENEIHNKNANKNSK